MSILKSMYDAARSAGATPLVIGATTGPHFGEDGYADIRLTGIPAGALVYWHASTPPLDLRRTGRADEWSGLMPVGTHSLHALVMVESGGRIGVGYVHATVRVTTDTATPQLNTNGGRYGG